VFVFGHEPYGLGDMADAMRLKFGPLPQRLPQTWARNSVHLACRFSAAYLISKASKTVVIPTPEISASQAIIALA
jgi:hypothetical protein